MSDHNGESHYQGNMPMMADLIKWLEALHPENGGPSTSATCESPPLIGADPTNK